jgi:hypothetical protein
MFADARVLNVLSDDRVDAALALPRAKRVLTVAERTPLFETQTVATAAVTRRVAMIAIAITLSLSLVDVTELAIFVPTPHAIAVAILGVVVTIPLHVRHLVYGVRDERPPAGAWTLTILAIGTFVGAVQGGEAWIRELAPLAVSILIVVPGAWAFLLAAGVTLSPLWLFNTHWFSTPDHQLSGIYCCVAIAWRTVTQFIPLRLLACLRALDAASAELEGRAVVQARVRIDHELRESVRPTLQQIVAHGTYAQSIVATDSDAAASDLRQLVHTSRRGLADARRIVSGYRTSSARRERNNAL